MSYPFVGEIRMFGFPRTPVGWLPCDGRLLQVSEYQVLFSLLNNAYGGDGNTTFALPDLRGRLPLHQGTGRGLTPRTAGQLLGTETVTLNAQQMPMHTHMLVLTTTAATTDAPSASVLPGAVTGDTYYLSNPANATPAVMNAAAVSTSGGNQAHENCMPTLTVQYCIAWEGIYPSRP